MAKVKVSKLSGQAPKKGRPAVTIKAAQRRTIGQFIAASAAAFMPLASYIVAHYETEASPWKWLLVLAALSFSAPTLAQWAQTWCKGQSKAWGFTILLEGVLIGSSTQYLAIAGLVILVSINCHSAWQAAKGK
jgi:hypothetical protein